MQAVSFSSKNVHRSVMMWSLLKHEVRNEDKAGVADMTLPATEMKNEVKHLEVNGSLPP